MLALLLVPALLLTAAGCSEEAAHSSTQLAGDDPGGRDSRGSDASLATVPDGADDLGAEAPAAPEDAPGGRDTGWAILDMGRPSADARPGDPSDVRVSPSDAEEADDIVEGTADLSESEPDASGATDTDVAGSDFDWLDASAGRWMRRPAVATESDLGPGTLGTLGLSGDRLLWSELASDLSGKHGRVHLTDLDGVDHVLFSGGDDLRRALTGTLVAGERFLSWAGNDGEDAILLYDLGPDHLVSTGDELLVENPFPLVRPGSDLWFVPFDWDLDAFELAFVVPETGSVEVRRLAVSSAPARLVVVDQATLCTDCVEEYGARHAGLAIHHGCVAFSDGDRQMQLYCRNNDAWGDGDDTETTISNAAGACSGELTKTTFGRGLRGIGVGQVDDRTVVAWIGTSIDRYPTVTEVCLWGEGTGPARAVSQLSPYTDRMLTLNGDQLFFLDLATGGSHDDLLEVKGLQIPPDLYSRPVGTVPIMPGRIGRLFASDDRVVIARRRDGPDWVEVYALREQLMTDQLADQVAPDVDRDPVGGGDRTVWVDYRDHRCGEVYLTDGASGGETRLTHTDCPELGNPLAVTCPRISGDYVVWSQSDDYYHTPPLCQGHLYGIDLGSAPLDEPHAVVHITSEMGEWGTDHAGIGRAQVSDGRVVFTVRQLGEYGPRVYLYEWGGEKPRPESPFLDGWGRHPDISGDRLVWVGGEMWSYGDTWSNSMYAEVRTCLLSEGCEEPTALTRHDDPCAGEMWEGAFFCYEIGRYRPRVEGNAVVWLDNRESFEIGAGFPAEAVFHLYYDDLSDPAEATRISTRPWRAGWGRGAMQAISGVGDSGQGYWDIVEPSIGYDPATDTHFVVITAPFDELEAASSRDVLRIDLDGPYAFEEQMLTGDSAWQSPPAANARGHVVWQDRRDGTFFQLRHGSEAW